MKNKICSKCKRKLSITEFYKSKITSDKLTSWCKKCYKKYNILNKEKISKRKNIWWMENRPRMLKLKKLWYKSNKKIIFEYWKKRRQKDKLFKILVNLRNRIAKVLNGVNKSKSTMNLLGCSIEFLKQHLEKQFIKGMSWQNYGKWETDHIKPCASFDLSKPSEQRKCFHYTNLQPLWAEDNRKKSDKSYD